MDPRDKVMELEAELTQLRWKCGELEDRAANLAAKVAELEDELETMHTANRALYDGMLKARRDLWRKD